MVKGLVHTMQENTRQMACHTTPRLDALKAALTGCRMVADIGCDHAYLPILLAQEDAAAHFIAADVREGPLLRAKENISRFGLADRIETRLGSGLIPVLPGECEAAVIAGMGGSVICNILQEGETVAKSLKRLVLQPMSAAPELRRFLYENGYIITDEILAQEDRRIYTIILAKKGQTVRFTSLDCYISPALREKRPPLFVPYAQKLVLQLHAAAEGMRQSKKTHRLLIDYEAILTELEILISI